MTQENTVVTTLVHCAITLEDPLGVLVGKVILKVDSINVQVTPQDLLNT